MIIAERLEKLESLILGHGSHSSFEQGACALEAVAWLAGEPHSDKPNCTCPVIASIVIGWNDALPSDEARCRYIRPLVPKLVGTRMPTSTPEEKTKSDSVLLKRMYMVQDWHVRVRTPAFLRLAGLTKEAEALEACAPIVDGATLNASREAADAARSAARSAAESAARSAAESAAESAAYSAARSAARSAAESAAYSAAESAARSAAESAAESAAYSAARSAAYSAAESAAYSAARSAAESAARSALASTVDALCNSFAELVVRMCEVTE